MTEPLKIKPVLTDLSEAPQPLQIFYQKNGDGKYHLKLDGDPPGFVSSEKLTEFRDNNRALVKAAEEHKATLAAVAGEVDTLKQRLAPFDGLDPVKAREALGRPDLRDEKAKLETELAATRATLAATKFRTLVATEFLRGGGEEKALDFAVTLAERSFELKGDTVEAREFSTATPGVRQTLAEWVATQAQTNPFLFRPSRGGGASPHPAGGGGGAPRKRVDLSDPMDVGRNLQGIANGEVDFDR